MSKKLLPIILEVVGIVPSASVLKLPHASIGWVLVTAGSCLVAGGSIIWGKFMLGGKE